MDVVLFAEGNQIVLSKQGMALNLIDGWNDRCTVDNRLELT
jgi:hypothetical protein